MNFIAKGKYALRPLNTSDIEQVLHIEKCVSQTLKDPKLYYFEPHEFFHEQLQNPNSAIGAFYNDQLVGFEIATFPGLNKNNLGIDIGGLNDEELRHVVQLGPGAIHPDHREKGLLKLIQEVHLESLKEIGYKHFLATISPNNYPSLKVTLSHGFIIKQLKVKYTDLLRYILHLDMDSSPKEPWESVIISSIDIEGQQHQISMGFYGYNVRKSSKGFDVMFGRDMPVNGNDQTVRNVNKTVL